MTQRIADIVTATLTRPADTTAYASGDLVANSTTAGSVTPLTFNAGASQGSVLFARIGDRLQSVIADAGRADALAGLEGAAGVPERARRPGRVGPGRRDRPGLRTRTAGGERTPAAHGRAPC